jgi:hypothetical protein
MAEKSQPRKDTRSVLRKAFDTVEGAVANRAEPIAQSGGFARVLGVYVSVNKGVRGVAGKATGGLLHLVNIPTTGDIGKLHQHLASVDSHLAALMRDRERAARLSELEPAPTDDEESDMQSESTVANRVRSKPVPVAKPASSPGRKTSGSDSGKARPDRKGAGG